MMDKSRGRNDRLDHLLSISREEQDRRFSRRIIVKIQKKVDWRISDVGTDIVPLSLSPLYTHYSSLLTHLQPYVHRKSPSVKSKRSLGTFNHRFSIINLTVLDHASSMMYNEFIHLIYRLIHLQPVLTYSLLFLFTTYLTKYSYYYKWISIVWIDIMELCIKKKEERAFIWVTFVFSKSHRPLRDTTPSHFSFLW